MSAPQTRLSPRHYPRGRLLLGFDYCLTVPAVTLYDAETYCLRRYGGAHEESPEWELERQGKDYVCHVRDRKASEP